MTLRRSPLKPGSGFKSQAFANADRKEASAVAKIRAKRCAVKSCRQPFTPDRPFITWCSPDCGTAVALAKVKTKKAKDERRSDKARKEALKGRRDWLKEAQVAFNAFIRERDKDRPCICCGRTSEKQYLTGTNWDCGHYRSVGSAPHMRFIENNAHRQLTICNRHGGGRAVDYRIGLIARIGLAAVEALETDNTPRKYTIEELKGIKQTYKAKLKQLKGEQ